MQRLAFKKKKDAPFFILGTTKRHASWLQTILREEEEEERGEEEGVGAEKEKEEGEKEEEEEEKEEEEEEEEEAYHEGARSLKSLSWQTGRAIVLIYRAGN